MGQIVSIGLFLIMALTGCGGAEPVVRLVNKVEIKKMSLEEFLQKAGYTPTKNGEVFQIQESENLHEREVQMKNFCSTHGGEWKSMIELLQMPQDIQYYPLEETVSSILNSRVSWNRNPSDIGLEIPEGQGHRIFENSKYCLIDKKPIFIYYPTNLNYYGKYTHIMIKTDIEKLNNLKKAVYQKPVAECKNYSAKIEPMIQLWEETVQLRGSLVDRKQKIKKKKNPYQEELDQVTKKILTNELPKHIQNISLISNRLSHAIAEEYNAKVLRKIRKKMRDADAVINQDYQKQTALIDRDLSKVKKAQNDLLAEIKKLNTKSLIELGIEGDHKCLIRTYKFKLNYEAPVCIDDRKKLEHNVDDKYSAVLGYQKIKKTCNELLKYEEK